MSENMLVLHCSPTLAGIKTGNLFSCPANDFEKLKRCIRALNRGLSRKGLRIIPLNCKKGRALIYVYRPNFLKRDFCNSETCEILNGCGYKCENAEACVAKLAKRLRHTDDFPHEIGLFLGYPPEDVKGFIENKAEHYKCVGHWKVYGDEQKAKKLFAKYEKCTKLYCEQWANGNTIERLTVAV
ncbi:MAG: DUF3793 family protein [Clostridia bacterium]|nr:DUF3793 family protein [Clostridia bacterium]